MADFQTWENRRREVLRLLDEIGSENIDELEAWDGSDLDALEEILGEDEYEALLDRMTDDELST